jgi:hypothetical protein
VKSQQDTITQAVRRLSNANPSIDSLDLSDLKVGWEQVPRDRLLEMYYTAHAELEPQGAVDGLGGDGEQARVLDELLDTFGDGQHLTDAEREDFDRRSEPDTA